MNEWFEFYHSRVNNKKYEEYFNKKYFVFLSHILQNIHEGDKVLEVGCGTSLVTKFLYKTNVHFKVIDNCRKMIELSSLNLKDRSVSKELHDIRNPLKETFNLIYSHGVLEHFSIKEIKTIIKHQLNVCDSLIHYVPSSHYSKQSFGDEILMTKEQWSEEINPTSIVEFNSGYDLILIWSK